MRERPRLVYVATTSPSTVFFDGQLAFMRDHGFDVTVVSAEGKALRAVASQNSVAAVSVRMEREIRPLLDLDSLQRMTRLFRKLRPQIVAAATPKAGLVAMIAARLSGVSVRVYLQYGLRLETAGGLKRRLLWAAERATIASSNRVLCVSESLRQRLIELQLVAAHKACVPASGSSSGVRVERFTPRLELQTEATRLRERWQIPQDAPVVGFVGRLTRDKGIVELAAAFQKLLSDHPSARLLLVGDFEPGDPVPVECVRRLREHPGVIVTGFVEDVPAHYQAMDVVAFPSYREGLPNVPLEAAAAGLPVVAFAATGTVDAVVPGVTGELVDIGDVDGLAQQLTLYLDDRSKRSKHGRAGQSWVQSKFQPAHVWQAVFSEFRAQLMTAGIGQSRTAFSSPEV